MRLFFRLLGRLIGLLLILLLLGLAYVHATGFPPFLINELTRQLEKTGVAAQFSSVRLELFRGVVATDARLAAVSEPDQTLVEIDEVQIQFSWRRFFESRNLIDSLRIANAVVRVPLPPDEHGQEHFTARDAYATFVFADDGTVRVARLLGEYLGIRLFVKGSFKPKTTAEPREPFDPRQFQFLTKVVRELNRISVTQPPELDLSFEVDMARPLASRATARLRGEEIEFRQLRVDRAEVDVRMQDGAIDIQPFRVELAGGKVELTGRYDIAQGRFDLTARSTTDPRAFAVFAPPALADIVSDVRVTQNPTLAVRYTLSPETGSLPVLQGDVETGGLVVRGVRFRRIKLNFHSQGPRVTVPDALIITPEGRLTGRGTFNIESTDFAYQLESTLDPTKLLPLMLPKIRAIVEPAWFERPPRIVASVVGDFVDPDNFAYDATLAAGRCSYRGVPMEQATGFFQLREQRLHARDVRLTRTDGVATGWVLADFERQRTEFDVELTTNPRELAPLLGPAARELMEPYRFGPVTVAAAAGVVDFAHMTNTAWTARVRNQGFSYWKFTAREAAADLVFTNNTLAINQFRADLYGGKLSGGANFSFQEELPLHQFLFDVADCDLRQVLDAVRGEEQAVTGTLSGKLALSGQGADTATLRGAGALQIRDGVLLEMPLFGVFSRILDEIFAGLGQMRATRAEATFTIANRAVATEDLKVAAGAFTLTSAGKVTLDGKLDFRVNAQILRQVPVLNIPGIILGKLFEYKIGGTISDPSYRPQHLPKEILPHDTN